MFCITDPEPVISFAELEYRYKTFCQYAKELALLKATNYSGIIRGVRLKARGGRTIPPRLDD